MGKPRKNEVMSPVMIRMDRATLERLDELTEGPFKRSKTVRRLIAAEHARRQRRTPTRGAHDKTPLS